MHVLAFGMDGLEDLILSACLENQAYDGQCEGNRARWMYEMIRNTPVCARVSEFIVEFMQGNEIDRDSEQVCTIAALMGRDGDVRAASAVRDYVWAQELDDGFLTGASAVISLDGIPAVVEVARRLGHYLQEHPGEYFDSLDTLTEGTPLFDHAMAELQRMAADDAAISVYLAAQKEEEARSETNKSEAGQSTLLERLRADSLRDDPVARILAAAANHDRTGKGPFMKFGRWASTEHLDRILDELHVESNPETCLRMLWIFRKATLPRFDNRIWSLAQDGPAELRAAALKALSTLKDPRLGDLGRARLMGGTFSPDDAEVIDLFIHNFRTGDETLLLAALRELTIDDDEAHFLGSSVIDVCEENNSPALSDLLHWIYSSNPCTICRKQAIQLLIASGSLAESTAIECLHDASRDIRDIVKNNERVPMFTKAIVRLPASNFADGLTTVSLGTPDFAKTIAQHERYCDALRECGLELTHLDADPRYPDSTFVEDVAILTERGAIMTRPGADSRAGEVADMRAVLPAFYPELAEIVAPGTLDGGDICEAGEHFVIGISLRTNEEGARQLAAWLGQLGYTTSFVDIRQTAGILHLKSGIAYIGENRMVVIDSLAKEAGIAQFDLVRVAPSEDYAANCVRVNKHVLMATGFPLLETTLRDLGYAVIALDMSEYQKMDGGLSCLSLRF